MHELPLISRIVADSLARMRSAGGLKVRRVQVLLGATGHLSPEALEQHFRILAAGTPAADAEVQVTIVPAEVRCFDCLHVFASVRPAFEVDCPRCGGRVLPGTADEICELGELEFAYRVEVQTSV